MATVEVISTGSGVTENERLQNTATAANNNGASVSFAANRTTAGLTNVAQMSGVITSIDSTSYQGALVFATANEAPPAEVVRITADGWVGIGTATPSVPLEVVAPDAGITVSGDRPILSLPSEPGGGRYPYHIH